MSTHPIDDDDTQELRVFLSYSTRDKSFASQVKRNLELRGCSVFLAHKDLRPSEEWQQRILQELNISVVFLPLITDNFRSSEWTDQEAGYALARGIVVLPVTVAPVDSPHGFLGSFQALPLHTGTPRTIEATCKEAYRIILDRTCVGGAVKSRAVRQFAQSGSYAESRSALRALWELAPFDREQTDTILHAAMGNNQIYDPPERLENIILFAVKHGDRASPDVLQAFHRFAGI